MSGLKECYAAFERLKANKPKVDTYKNIDPASVTPAIVSKEAGLDAGYLKRSRSNHQPLITLINAYKNNAETTKSVRKRDIEALKEAKTTAETAQEALQNELEAALGRELLLVRQLKKLEDEKKELLQQLNSNVVSL